MLRVFVSGGGCSGFQYGFTFEESANEDDTRVEKSGVTLLVDPLSFQYLAGAEIDYKEDLNGAQFVIKNPQAKTTCGCGSSFSTWTVQRSGAVQGSQDTRGERPLCFFSLCPRISLRFIYPAEDDWMLWRRSRSADFRFPLPGVWCASQANAVASTQSGASPRASVVASGSGLSRARNRSIKSRLCAPPPQTNTSLHAGRKRWIASAMPRVVSSASVACTSCGRMPAGIFCVSQSGRKCSRPVLFGGGAAK